MVVLFGQHVLIKSLALILEVYCAFQSWYKLWSSSYAPSHWHPLLIMPKVNFVAHALGSNYSFHMFLHFLLLFNLTFTWIGSTMTWSTSTLWLWLELPLKVRTCNPYNQRKNTCAWIFLTNLMSTWWNKWKTYAFKLLNKNYELPTTIVIDILPLLMKESCNLLYYKLDMHKLKINDDHIMHEINMNNKMCQNNANHEMLK